MLKNKSDAFYKLTAFYKKIKLLTSRYPSIQRIDSGTEFKEFIKQGKAKGMTFKITPLYIVELNGTVERFGGYINDIQRTIIINTGILEDIWLYVTETAIYIYNRLVNLKTKVSPLTHQREELEIENPKPSLKHFRPQGSTAYVYIPKAKRVQVRKAAPRAQKGKLVGYKGDRGYIYKVQDPTTKKVTTSRDIGFLQLGDEDDSDIGLMLV